GTIKAPCADAGEANSTAVTRVDIAATIMPIVDFVALLRGLPTAYPFAWSRLPHSSVQYGTAGVWNTPVERQSLTTDQLCESAHAVRNVGRHRAPAQQAGPSAFSPFASAQVS